MKKRITKEKAAVFMLNHFKHYSLWTINYENFKVLQGIKMNIIIR